MCLIDIKITKRKRRYAYKLFEPDRKLGYIKTAIAGQRMVRETDIWQYPRWATMDEIPLVVLDKYIIYSSAHLNKLSVYLDEGDAKMLLQHMPSGTELWKVEIRYAGHLIVGLQSNTMKAAAIVDSIRLHRLVAVKEYKNTVEG